MTSQCWTEILMEFFLEGSIGGETEGVFLGRVLYLFIYLIYILSYRREEQIHILLIS